MRQLGGVQSSTSMYMYINCTEPHNPLRWRHYRQLEHFFIGYPLRYELYHFPIWSTVPDLILHPTDVLACFPGKKFPDIRWLLFAQPHILFHCIRRNDDNNSAPTTTFSAVEADVVAATFSNAVSVYFIVIGIPVATLQRIP